MNACPNCNAEMKFDIASQMLACPFCGAKVDPKTYTDFGAAAEEERISAVYAQKEEGIAQDVAAPVQMQYGPSAQQAGGNNAFSQAGGGIGGGFAGQGSGGYGSVSGSFASGTQGMAGPQQGGVSQPAFAQQGSGGGSFASVGAIPVAAPMSAMGAAPQAGTSGAFPVAAAVAAPMGAMGAAPQAGASGAIPVAASMGAMGAAPQAGTSGAFPVAAAVAAPMGAMGATSHVGTSGAIPAAAPMGAMGTAPQAGAMSGYGAIPAGTVTLGTMQQSAGMTGMAQDMQQDLFSGGMQQAFQDYDPTANAEELEVIAYNCPQCGGSIYSTDESVNGFCSFCGSNVMLQSRVAKMKYPKYVIPFRVNKNACKQYYLNNVKKAFFAPKELKDPEFLDHFRGIYMPYWGYDVMYYSGLMMVGTHSYRRGDYVFTEHYNCSGRVDAFYKGLSYDASSSFDDHFSEQIAPYDAHAMVDFSPAYLSGFYADLQDVSYHVYEEDALHFGRDRIFESIKKQNAFPGVTFSENQKNLIHPAVDTRHDGVYTAFFPVWFLSYRKNDRVAYAVVNGQTGRLVSDLPVDKKKFLLSALVMAVPIFALLLLLPTMMPSALVLLAEVFSIISVLLLMGTIKKVGIRDMHINDKGYLSKYDRITFQQHKKEADRKKKEKEKAGSLILIVFAIAVFMGPMGSMIASALFSTGNTGRGFLALLISIVLVVINASNTAKIKMIVKEKTGPLLLGIWLIFAATLYGALVIFADPVNNFWYYLGVIALFAGTLLGQLMALEQYNLLTTRPLPQLNRKGGDDSAQD